MSASHLDWSMIPYVRKSFYKHYKDGLKYIANLSDKDIESEMSTSVDVGKISIEDTDIYVFPEAYRYAMDMTTKETYQAVEGMYHNLK